MTIYKIKLIYYIGKMGITFRTKTDSFSSMSCSCFNDIRRFIGLALGYKTKELDYGMYKSTVIDVDYDSFQPSNFKGIWKEEPSDPMLYLFVHSDYDGHFEANHISQMLPHLEKARLWFESQEGIFKLIYLKEFDNLLNGFKRASKNNERVSI